jgi:hypothetical protein
MTQSKKFTSTFKEEKLLQAEQKKFIPDPLLHKQNTKVFNKIVIPVIKAK